ncbi:MAG: T9SS type A sorting domain-containing protein, partial [Sediminibacterium sp.]
MKKILTFFSLIILAASMSAQTIPNGDFENWTAGSPDSWATYNDLAALIGINPAPVTQESPAPSGNSYLKAVSRFSILAGDNFPGLALLGNADPISGTGSNGVPFTQTPIFFSGVYKHETVSPNDTMLIVCQLSKWDPITNSQIAVGTALAFNFGTSVSNWTNFSLPIQYQTTDTPDSLSIIVASIGGDGAAVSVDNLAFSATSIGVNNIQLTEKSINLFPNPASSQTLLDLNAIEEQLALGVKIEVIDLTGRVVETHLSVRNRIFKLNTSNLDAGKYLVR